MLKLFSTSNNGFNFVREYLCFSSPYVHSVQTKTEEVLCELNFAYTMGPITMLTMKGESYHSIFPQIYILLCSTDCCPLQLLKWFEWSPPFPQPHNFVQFAPQSNLLERGRTA